MSLPDPSAVRKQLAPAPAAGDKEELPTEYKFALDVTDGRGKRYTGEFVYRVPNLGEQIEIGQLKTRYLPTGVSADAVALMLVEQICYLEVTLKVKPDWWKPFTFLDATPVSAAYAEATEYERRFHGGAPRSKAAAGEAEGQEGPGRDPAQREDDVEPPVQAPAKRPPVVISHPKGGG